MTVESRWPVGLSLVDSTPAVLRGAPSVQQPTLWMAHGAGTVPPGWETTTAVVNGAELSALVTDSALVPVLGPVHVAVGTAQTRQVKAAAVAVCVPRRVRESAILHRGSAAWFHACATPPSVLEFVTHRENRCSTRPAPPSAAVRWTMRQLLYEPQDVDHFHGCCVTTPLRTAADLACWEDPAGLAALRLLLTAPHLVVDGAQVVGLLRARSRLPHRTRGVITVRKVCRQLGLPVPA